MLEFEWDELKALSSLRKHRLTFEEAVAAFSDNLSLTIPDPLHSHSEHRFVLIGYSNKKKLLVVVHTERGEKVRIISARQATRQERRFYDQGK
ncbi:MAG: BrnT family toxin [Elusimicrobia bacterium]|nr:BrnT family toxin [Elusimicrobiota bacterium]